MLTLNQIRKKLVDFFEGHAQIHQVVYADDFDFNAERSLTYPVSNIEFVDAAIKDRFLDYNFKVVLGSIVPDDTTDTQDYFVSDALLIAEDLFSFLQHQEGWVFRKSSSLQKFVEDGGDRVSGIVFRITLSVVRSQNDCVKPT